MADRWVGRAGTIAFVLAALALARVIGTQFPDAVQEFELPHAVGVEVGEAGSLRTAEITVEELRLGTELTGPGTILPSPGVWLVADVTFTPTLEDARPLYVEVLDEQGRSFRATRAGTNSCTTSPPGVPMTCSVAVELPADAWTGASLRLGTSDDPRFDNLLVLPLPVTADQVEQAAGRSVELRPASPGGTS